MLSLNTVIAHLLDNASSVEFTDVQKLANVVRKHERASAAFLADLSTLNADEFKRNVSSLAASYKADISKSGLSYDALTPVCDALHKRILERRNKHKAQMIDANKNREGFDVVRRLAAEVKAFDSMLSSIANLKSNAAQIARVVSAAA